MNNQHSAKIWVEFICGKAGFSNPSKLREQFDSASFSEFCDCGCNSFKVSVDKTTGVKPISEPGEYGAFFESDFYEKGDNQDPPRTLEFVLFSDEEGYLSYVEIDYCANTFPVPESVEVESEPFHIRESGHATL
jgi:hypothetical protein